MSAAELTAHASAITLELQRLFVAGATVGMLRTGGPLEAPDAWTLEPAVPVPAGSYELRLRRYGPKYEKYRARYPWNEPGMLELLDVPGHTDILIHPGNMPSDTLGCVLVGYGAFCYGELAESVEAYRQVYNRVALELVAGGRAWLHIKDQELHP